MATEGIKTKPFSVVRSEQHWRLDAWLKKSTKGLCEPAVEYVRQQVREQGSSVEELGDPNDVNQDLVALHLTPLEYSSIRGILLPPPRIQWSFGWKEFLIISIPALLGISLFAGLWLMGSIGQFPRFVLFIFPVPIFVIGSILLFLSIVKWSRRFHTPSIYMAIRRQLLIGVVFGLIFESLLLIEVLMSDSFMEAMNSLITALFFLSVFAWSGYLQWKVLRKVGQLEVMGVPYVKPYWEKLEEQQQPV